MDDFSHIVGFVGARNGHVEFDGRSDSHFVADRGCGPRDSSDSGTQIGRLSRGVRPNYESALFFDVLRSASLRCHGRPTTDFESVGPAMALAILEISATP